jgi:hypothetical protein
MIHEEGTKETLLQEAMRRLDDVPPQTPLTVIKGVTVRRKKKGLTVMRLHYSAIPDRDPSTMKGAAWYARERKDYASEARWRKEQEIDANATGGEAVFGTVLSQYYEVVIISDPLWAPETHLGKCDVVGSFDHGVTNATCLLKGYVPTRRIDPVTGRSFAPELYVCGEYYSYRREGWDNTVEQNAAVIMRGGLDPQGNLVPQLERRGEPMPDLDRARWINADPSIFYDAVAQEKGKPTNVYKTYHRNGFYTMRAYTGNRSDVAFVEWILSDYWRGIASGHKPRLYIVCRNPSDRPQPGLHPYDCPNLVWEMKRAKRVQLTARQLLTRNPSESLQDKDNHALDCLLGGTMITTQEGLLPIEEVPVGTKVLTRMGWRAVQSAWLANPAATVYRARFSNGAEIIGTGKHLIFVDGHDFVRLDAMKTGMVVTCDHQVLISPTKRTDYVSFVAGYSPVGAKRKPNIVRSAVPVKLVEIHKLDGLHPVYDLTITDQHEFFANGILVHNCLKEMTGTLRNPTDVPFEEELREKMGDVSDPFTKQMRARYLMSEAMLHGKIGPDGKVRHKKTAVVVDLRRSPSMGRMPRR